jgi:hypothetical protein
MESRLKNMGKGKNARREEAERKAKRKKGVITFSCAAAGAVVCLVLINLLRGVPGDGGVIFASDADIDLTPLSVTMKYAEAVNIYQDPEKYLGKTIRVDGAYNASLDETTGTLYQAVLIVDTLACCATGFYFELDEGAVFSTAGEPTVEVTGVFSSFETSGITNYYLADAEAYVI